MTPITPQTTAWEPEPKGFDEISRLGIFLFGVYSIVLALTLVAGLIFVWPEDRPFLALRPDTRLTLIVALSGALGSYIHVATSFAEFVGNRMLLRSWIWWYILRPFIGLSYSILVYFTLRGVMFNGTASGGGLNPYGVAAVAGLIGMFSKQATDKVREVFETFFRTERAPARADTLSFQRTSPSFTGSGKSTSRGDQ